MGYTSIKLATLLYFCTILILVCAKKSKDDEKPKWAKKDIRDYNDADMERLLDQWEVKHIIFTIFIYE